MNKRLPGFAVLETLLIVVILAIVGGIGWYAIHTKHQTDKILSQADKISQNTLVKNNKTSSKPTNKLINYTDAQGHGGVDIKTASDVNNLIGASNTFKQFVVNEVNKYAGVSQCDQPYEMTVQKIYNDQFAVGGVAICVGHEALWYNSSGIWKEIAGTQNVGFKCDILEQYMVPSDIAGGQCVDSSGVETYSQS